MAVRCGNPIHKTFYPDLAFDAHHHDSTAQVRLCFARSADFGLRSHEEEMLEQDWSEQMRAEYEAEMAVERYYENRGAEENYAFEQWEHERGVIQFEDAYRMAMGD